MKDVISLNNKKSLIPTICQSLNSGEVLMLGYVNEKALQKTLKTGFAHFWSRSRNKLWMKGEKSGNKLQVQEIYVDCDKDTLLFKVNLIGSNVCHTGNLNCFYTKLKKYEVKSTI